MRLIRPVEPATIHEEGYSLVVDHFVSFGGKTEEPLIWTRPNFFALRYELVCAEGVLARVSVRGIGSHRYVLAETASGNWRIAAFPLSRTQVDILEAEGETLLGRYRRGTPASIEFADGSSYLLRPNGLHKSILETSESAPIFELEEVEHFPRWRVEMRIDPSAAALPELPVLAVSTCCMLVFYRQAGNAPALTGNAAG